MLHPVHFFIDSLGFLRLKQPEMQVRRNIHRKGDRILRLNAQQR
jgi:hypothetical protein